MEAPVENGSGYSTSTDNNSVKKPGHFDSRRFSLTSNYTDSTDSLISNNIRNREVNADTTALICLLQSVGFQLKKFDKVTGVNELKKSNINNNNELVRVTIECEASGMRADLEYRNPQCTCPKEDTNASLWNISGTGQFLSGSCTSINNLFADEKFIESGSNLLPSLDKETVLLLGDRLGQLIFLVNSYGKQARQDGDRGEDGGREAGEPSLGLKSNLEASFLAQQSFQDLSLSVSMTRCHTQPEIFTRDEMSDRRFSLNPTVPRILTTQPTEERTGPVLIRQSTFELKDEQGEPRSSPPKISSSPVTICSSLGQVSLASDEGDAESLRIGTLLGKASYYLEKARRMYCTKHINDECSSIEFSNSPRDDVFLKPRGFSRNSSTSSQRASPVTVRKKNQSDSKSPSVPKTLMKPQIRRSLSNSTYSSSRKPSLTSAGTGVSPATLSRIKQNTTPKLPPRTRSIGTPSPTQRVALEVAKKRASLTVSNKSGIPAARVLCKPSTVPGSKIVLPVGSKLTPSRPANQTTAASTLSAGINEEKKSLLLSSLSLDKSRLKKNNSSSSIESNLKNGKPTPVKDGGKKNYNYSASFGLKK